ncbi:DUF6214 family protein [Streptomyces jumonjinensis]|uniref:DUF6214 family protein n=1 Tax=Streptomyces jumonjinensis TaxID=1945 RepID=UPI00378B121F
MLPYPPVWELQGQGTVSEWPAGDGRAAATALPGRATAPAPWFDVRLTFADGTRLDVLAVVAEGRIAVEDLRADPPLPLAGLTVLAERIGEPLRDACRTAVRAPAGGVEAPVARDGRRAAGGGASVARDARRTADGDAPPAVPQDEAPAAAPGRAGDRTARPAAHRRAAGGAPPRGRAARRAAAEVYRTAQRDGSDPVLAVMSATGHSRRKSLRLIAGARDDGYLAPRHHRR